jgi:hypothetical protein
MGKGIAVLALYNSVGFSFPWAIGILFQFIRAFIFTIGHLTHCFPYHCIKHLTIAFIITASSI